MPDSAKPDKPRNTALEREIATIGGGRDITRGWVDQLHYLQPQDTILQLRGGYNYEVYRDLLRDDQVAAVFGQRRLALVSRPTRVIPGGERRIDKKAAEFIEATLEHIRWDTVTDRMLYGRFYGYGIAECLWGRDGTRVVLDKLKVRDRRRFVFGPDFQPRLVTTTNPDGETLPPQKFWWLATGADHDDEPYGLGLGHWLYWPVLFKREQTGFWLTWADKFGAPTVVGKYPRSASDDDKRLVHNAGKAVAHETTVAIPDHMQLELLEAARSGNSSYAEFYDRLNAAISKVVIGQTMTTDDGSSRSQADVHLSVRDDIVAADARLICDSFNRSVVRWLIGWNFPGAAYPRVERELDDAPDLQALAERDEIVIRMMGRRPDAAYIKETYGIDLVDEVATKDVANKPPVPPAEPRQAALAEPDGDALVQQTREALGPKLEAWVAGLAAQVNKAASLADYRDWLDNAALAALDDSGMTVTLGDALLVAYLKGRDDAAAIADVSLAEDDGASLPFREQIDFFKRKFNLPTRTWTDIWQSQHDVAFVVAGAVKADLINDLRTSVHSAIAEGTTLARFRKDFDGIVARHDWHHKGGRDWRTRVIYETNLRTSYAAGRWQQLQAVKATRPYWRYRHSDATTDPRPEHLAWDGLILAADDPWWKTHYPPNGWGCQCYVEALSKRDLKRLDRKGPDRAPALNRREVTVGTRGPRPRKVDVPEGIDPGFAYAPGEAVLSRTQQYRIVTMETLLRGAEQGQPTTGATRIMQASIAQNVASEPFRRFIRTTVDADNQQWPIATLRPARIKALGMPEQARVVRLSSQSVDSHRERFVGFANADWARVQRMVDIGTGIDEGRPNHRSLLFRDEGKDWKAVIKRSVSGEVFLVTCHRISKKEVKKLQNEKGRNQTK